MKKQLLVAVSIIGVVLSGCSGGVVVPAPVVGNLVALVQEVDVLTVAACGFLPAEQAVEEIFAAGNPELATAQSVANVVCAAVGAKGASAAPVPVGVARRELRRGGALVPLTVVVVVSGQLVVVNGNLVR